MPSRSDRDSTPAPTRVSIVRITPLSERPSRSSDATDDVAVPHVVQQPGQARSVLPHP